MTTLSSTPATPLQTAYQRRDDLNGLISQPLQKVGDDLRAGVLRLQSEMAQADMGVAAAFYADVLHGIGTPSVDDVFEDALLTGWEAFAEKLHPTDHRRRAEYYRDAWRLAPAASVSGLGERAKMLALKSATQIPQSEPGCQDFMNGLAIEFNIDSDGILFS